MRLRERQLNAQCLSAHPENRTWPIPSPFPSREILAKGKNQEVTALI